MDPNPPFPFPFFRWIIHLYWNLPVHFVIKRCLSEIISWSQKFWFPNVFIIQIWVPNHKFCWTAINLRLTDINSFTVTCCNGCIIISMFSDIRTSTGKEGAPGIPGRDGRPGQHVIPPKSNDNACQRVTFLHLLFIFNQCDVWWIFIQFPKFQTPKIFGIGPKLNSELFWDSQTFRTSQTLAKHVAWQKIPDIETSEAIERYIMA